MKTSNIVTIIFISSFVIFIVGIALFSRMNPPAKVSLEEAFEQLQATDKILVRDSMDENGKVNRIIEDEDQILEILAILKKSSISQEKWIVTVGNRWNLQFLDENDVSLALLGVNLVTASSLKGTNYEYLIDIPDLERLKEIVEEFGS